MNLFHAVSRHREHRVTTCGCFVWHCEWSAHFLSWIIAAGKSWVYIIILKQNIRVWSGEQNCDQTPQCFMCACQWSKQCWSLFQWTGWDPQRIGACRKVNSEFCVKSLEKFIETDVENEAPNLRKGQSVLFAQRFFWSFCCDTEVLLASNGMLRDQPPTSFTWPCVSWLFSISCSENHGEGKFLDIDFNKNVVSTNCSAVPLDVLSDFCETTITM